MKLPWQNWSWPSWLPFQRWKVVTTVESADEIPEKLPRRGAAVVSSGGRTKWIAFDCPCGSGHRIMLNLDTGRKPAWKLVDADGSRLTIGPSIDYKDPTKRCHYFIRNGRVDWT
jgi:hypothetical protein